MQIDSLHSLGSRGVQLHRDMKKRKKVFAMPSALDDPVLQVAERCGPLRKKQKARRVEEEEVDIVELPTLEPVRIIETHEAASGGESYEEKKRRKKMKVEEVVVVSSALDNPISQLAERSERCRKKDAKKIKEEAVDILELPMLEPVRIIGTHEAASGGELHDLKKTRRKKMKIEKEEVIVEIVETNEAANGGESHEERKKKRKKKVKMEEVIVTAEPLQIVESHESAELHEEKKKEKKKRKKKKVKMEEEVVVVAEPLQIVENHEAAESHEEKKRKKEKKKRKKKKVKMEEEVVVVAEPLQIVENHEAAESHEEKKRKKEKKKRKKKKVKMEEEVVVVAEPLQIIENHEAADSHEEKKKRKKKVKLEEEEGIVVAHTLEPVQIVETHEAPSCEKPHGKGKERRKNKNMEEDPSAPLALDLSQITEPHKKKRKKESPTDGVVYGKYSAEEDAALKQALFDFIREKGWNREDGIYKIIHSKSGETLGCWPTIGKCLPHREAGSIYERARKLFGERLGKWTSAEVEALKELHRVHGNQWTRISEAIGRDRNACCRKWHNCVKWSNSLNHKTGRWSEEERQKLHTLVLKFLHEKSQVAKTGQLNKNHRGTRDDIDWVSIAEQMEGRSGSQCANKWYALATRMESFVTWSNGDDQPLLQR